MNGLDYNEPVRICEKCGCPVQKDIKILNSIKRVPVICPCRKEALNKKAIEDENKEKQYRLQRVFKASLMDEKFTRCTFEAWDHNQGSEKIYKVCSKYTNNFKAIKEKNIGLFIYGKPGNGKTYSVSCIANALLGKGVPVICVGINQLLSRIKESYNKYGHEAESDILKALANADLLIIDDLGTEQENEWSQSRIYSIIDARYRNELPLIVTTNIDIKELEKRYPTRTFDRLKEMCTPVLNDMDSVRRGNGIEKTSLLKELLG